MTTPTPEIFIVGAGPVGTALAMKLSRAGLPVTGIHARQADQASAAGALAGVLATSGEYPALVAESDIVIVAVSDEAIVEVAQGLVAAKRLHASQVVLHCSGAMAAAEALAPAAGRVAGRGTLHPLVSFADARVAAGALRGATFTIEGDPAGREAARRLAQALGGNVVEIEGERMPLYHAAAVITCNYMVALAQAGVTLLEQAGFPKELTLPSLMPLIGGTVRNLGELGIPAALTGPIARGDAQTVGKHLHALAASAPELVELYRACGLQAVRVAQAAPGADRAKLEAIVATLEAKPAAAKPAAARKKPTRRK